MNDLQKFPTYYMQGNPGYLILEKYLSGNPKAGECIWQGIREERALQKGTFEDFESFHLHLNGTSM